MKQDKFTTYINRKFSRRRQERMFAGLVGCLVALVFCRACAGEPKIVEVEVTPQPTAVAEAVESVSAESLAIARVLYGVRDYHLSDTAKTAIIEVILNRVEDNAREFRTYNTILDVVNQPMQWQGYEPDGAYLADDLKLVEAKLADHSGARVTPEGCYFLNVTQGKVTVRTLFSGGNSWSVE